MTRALLTFLFIFLFTSPLFADFADTAWVRRYNGPGNSQDIAIAIAVDDSDNVYVTGQSLGNGTGWDYATLKYYPDGETAWVRRYNGSADSSDVATALAMDGTGNVYVTGYSQISGSDFDYVTLKYYPDGETAWVRRYNGPESSDDRASDIAVDDSGNVCVTGYSFSSVTNKDYATVKYDINGNELWMKMYNGTGNGGDKAN
ncbi:MAG: SBBP repeat-containing protein, partial [candidate division Zixibacteria bacterium]|nr:SBBP repeat-containing protein [candidate division Zixibacteria bacterium]